MQGQIQIWAKANARNHSETPLWAASEKGHENMGNFWLTIDFQMCQIFINFYTCIITWTFILSRPDCFKAHKNTGFLVVFLGGFFLWSFGLKSRKTYQNVGFQNHPALLTRCPSVVKILPLLQVLQVRSFYAGTWHHIPFNSVIHSQNKEPIISNCGVKKWQILTRP